MEMGIQACSTKVKWTLHQSHTSRNLNSRGTQRHCSSASLTGRLLERMKKHHVFFLSELWWLYRELKGLSMNIPWEGLCSQVSCSNTSIPLEEIPTLPNKSKHALSHRTVPVHWLMEKFSVYGFLGSIYRVTKTSSKATSYAGKILWSHTLKFCFSWGHLNTVWRETRVDNKVQSKRPCAFLISGLLCVSLVLWYKPKWHVSVMGGTKIMLQFVLLYITPLLTAAEAWHEGPWNICIRKTATP